MAMKRNYEASSVDVPSREDKYRREEIRNQKNLLFLQINEYILKVQEANFKSEFLQELMNFKDFFEKYNNYFWCKDVEEKSKKVMSYECVLSAALEHTREVWVRFSWAINQRFSPVYKRRLEEADKISNEIFDRSKNIVREKPIIYFDKQEHITYYPYQRHPLLGIPFDRFEIDGDLVMAHELGHHVFWNNGDISAYKKRMDKLKKCINDIVFDKNAYKKIKVNIDNDNQAEVFLREQTNIYITLTGWVEEIFADVYGTLLFGPEYAKNSQDIMVKGIVSKHEDLLENDGEHPMPFLRPLIPLQALHVMAKKEGGEFESNVVKLIEVLEKRWKDHWSSVIKELKDLPKDSNSFVDPVKLEGYLVFLVEKILTVELFSDENSDGTEMRHCMLDNVEYWGKNNNVTQEENLDEYIRNYSKDILIRDPVDNFDCDVYRLPGIIENPFDMLLESKRKGVAENSNTSEWQEILNINLNLVHHHEGCQTHRATLVIRHMHKGYDVIPC